MRFCLGREASPLGLALAPPPPQAREGEGQRAPGKPWFESVRGEFKRENRRYNYRSSSNFYSFDSECKHASIPV